MDDSPLKLGQEYPPANEGELIDQIADIILQAHGFILVTSSAPRRLPHPKAHGCLNALFTVRKDLPEHLNGGVFKAGREYRAKIRFSNGDLKAQDDHEPDIRGMAIKLFVDDPRERGSSGLEQDFVLANDKVFFSRNAEDYMGFTASVTKFKGLDAHFENYPDLGKIYRRSQVVISSPLEHQYYSQVPFMLGKGRPAVKYSAKPSLPVSTLPADSSPDFLRKALAEHLKTGPAAFDFLVQVQKDPGTMPVEDSAVEWPEGDSPFEKVATIMIPPQAVGECEALSFNPWNALPEHRPLGGINRIRRAVYQRAAEARRKPKTQDTFTGVMKLKDPGAVGELAKILKENGLVNAFALKRLGFVHFARFFIVVDEVGGTKIARFIIVTTFDFDFRDYVQAFIEEIGDVFDQLVVLMQDAPPTPVREHREEFMKYVKQISSPPAIIPALFYGAYPDYSVQNVLKMEP
jgi:hypothetical protein